MERGTAASCTRRENGKAEGNLNEETRDNAWAKRLEQNETSGMERKYRGGWSESGGGEGENNRGIKLEAAE